ncbi:MAG: hypothetical protein ACKVZJ_05395 [Phycisphaerales bacterium]
MNRSNHSTIRLAPASLVLAALMLPGCGKQEEAPQQAAPVAVREADPMEGITLHAKVQWNTEKYRPANAAQAQAVAALANALASGNADDAKGVLDEADRALLADMIALGEWTSQTGGIEAVRVCVLKESEDKAVLTLGLGIQDALGAYVLAWRGNNSASPITFSGMAIQPVTADAVAMLDDAELRPPQIAAAAVETKITKAVDPGDVAASSSSSSPGEGPAAPRRPFQKPSGE